MGTMIIRDEAFLSATLLDDPEIAERLTALPDNATITLRVAGEPIRFRRLPDDTTRSEPGLAVDPSSEAAWMALRQRRRGEQVSVEIESGLKAVDPYLLSLSMLLEEWNSPEDAAAYDGL
jgi:hypothetical protein